MKKRDLANAVADVLGSDKSLAMAFVDETLTQIKTAVINGDTVSLRGFATIYPRHCKAKVCRNVKKNEQMILPAQHKVKMIVARDWNDSVRDNLDK